MKESFSSATIFNFSICQAIGSVYKAAFTDDKYHQFESWQILNKLEIIQLFLILFKFVFAEKKPVKMLRFVVLSTCAILCAANPYGYGGGYEHSIPAAVYSHHNVEVVPVKSYGQSKSISVDVPSSANPIYMNFQTQSSPLYVKQQHYGAKGSYQHSSSQDEPHRLVHHVTKPVYQELYEVVKPYRKVVQKIEPVHEEITTIVKKGEHKDYGYDHGYEQKSYEPKGYEMKGYEQKGYDQGYGGQQYGYGM